MDFSAIKRPWVEIVEGPINKTRFRYRGEKRCEILYGEKTNPKCKNSPKTYFKIRVNDLPKHAIARVQVSCVTNTEPYRVHPHNLHRRETKILDSRVKCENGVCSVELTKDYPEIEFKNIGIMAIPKKYIFDNLDKKFEEKNDPFNAGFEHQKYRCTIDLSTVRLAVETEVIMPGNEAKYKLATVVTGEIKNDLKATNSVITITALSHESAPVAGGQKIIILTEKKVSINDEVWFYQLNSLGEKIWLEKFSIQAVNIHHQKTIIITTPPYSNQCIEEPVDVFICLRRQSKSTTSVPHRFTLLPDEKYSKVKKRKRIATGNVSSLLAMVPEEVNETCTCVSCPVHIGEAAAAAPGFCENYEKEQTEQALNEIVHRNYDQNYSRYNGPLLYNAGPSHQAERFSNVHNGFLQFNNGTNDVPVANQINLIPATITNNLNINNCHPRADTVAQFNNNFPNFQGFRKRSDDFTVSCRNECWTDYSVTPINNNFANPEVGLRNSTTNYYSKQEMNINNSMNNKICQKSVKRQTNTQQCDERNNLNQNPNIDINVGLSDFKSNFSDEITRILDEEILQPLSDSFLNINLDDDNHNL